MDASARYILLFYFSLLYIKKNSSYNCDGVDGFGQIHLYFIFPHGILCAGGRESKKYTMYTFVWRGEGGALVYDIFTTIL